MIHAKNDEPMDEQITDFFGIIISLCFFNCLYLLSERYTFNCLLLHVSSILAIIR